MNTRASDDAEHLDDLVPSIEDVSASEEPSDDPGDADDAGTTSGGRAQLKRSTLFGVAVVTVLVAVGSLVTIAIEQHRQTAELRRQSCLARASAVAQVATIELQKGSELVPDAGLALLFCDGE